MPRSQTPRWDLEVPIGKAQRAIGELQYRRDYMTRERFAAKYGEEILDWFRHIGIATVLPRIQCVVLEPGYRGADD